MSRHLSSEDHELGRRLGAALQARTTNEIGRPDSLRRILQAHQPATARPSSRPTRWRRLGPSLGIAISMAAILAIVLVVHALATPAGPTTPPARPQPSIQPLPNAGAGYAPSAYYPAVRSDGQPVIVRGSDDQPVRILPRGQVSPGRYAPISPMVLSPDGNRLYGIGRNLRDDGSRYPPDAHEGSEHVVYIDLATNQFTSLATRDGLMAGFSLSADGTTFAYALRGGQDGLPDRDVIYIHDIVRDSDRHFRLNPGQRAVVMALSPDGSQLAITPANDPTDVVLMSTLYDDAIPGQQTVDAAACPDVEYGPIQWTTAGLYAVRTCHQASSGATSSVIRWTAPPSSASTVVISLRAAPTALRVQDTADGPVVYTGQQASGYEYTRESADESKPAIIHGFRLSGPDT